ncbi:hypothetical protein [Siphonobacter sp. SORGH_AS_1065]|uniref:hypothetical protein n=1 Tax=Siphonobacter sp. SORGH_AS_1065 TaxID=3041795 RepID=UPI0027879902|nr:hypothetical protein [Siphonobacter sp. SORGH_AS_1065]MDQ1089731.1 4-hydroxybenzoate polyprenyltransferase [Siphonobacter sp. SORGH_AS_1065]
MRAIQFLFFSNYFLGLLALMLSLETAFQLDLPFASPAYYVLVVSAVIVYYTVAYTIPATAPVSRNPRTEWYRQHAFFVRISQLVLSMIGLGSAILLLVQYGRNLTSLPFIDYVFIALVPLAGLLYYGMGLTLNLRDTGWLKAFVIGFVWAGCVSLMPVFEVQLEHGSVFPNAKLEIWLFIKNWMFCTVNAIMFDLKDYADDANRQLKTFVVQFGLRKTIYFILIPLLLIGVSSFFVFASVQHFSTLRIAFNALPYFALLAVAYGLHHRRKILYYLVVIDGLLLVKACCGIAGSYFGG